MELENRALARRAAAEGFVLLENDGVLPLKDRRIALYGSGARMTVKGGTGSGAVRERYSVTIAQGLENAGIEIATTDWLDRFDKFYADTYEAYRQQMEKKVEGMREFHQILHAIPPFRHPTGIPVTEADVAASACDTAIYVLARQAGEGNDRRDEQGDYRLDDVERENLEFVSKAYKNFVVIINAGGVIDVSFLDTLHISALVYFVQGGEEGGNALADVLCGKLNFSGKLATSWAYRFEDLPSNSSYSYLGGDEYNQEYNEGIYVGYRFFDSFGVRPRYAFGYGLSYTDFSIAFDGATLERGRVKLSISMTNEGHVPGREVAQLYATVPFGSDGTTKAARVPETLEAYRRYLFGFSRVELTSQMARPEDGTVHDQSATAWPCSQLLAQSFDTALMERVSTAVGAEMEAFGVTVWLSPGMNIHRNPLCGRTFEYYSEDPLVSGKMAAAIVRGVQSHPGKGMSVKHFAANNCELQRNFSSSNMTERTLRELYLRGFEIAVKESSPATVMVAYNKVNGVYCVNNYDLLVKVLRNEWGFQGLVMSDWDSMKADRSDPVKPLSGDVQKAPSAQCDLICHGRPDQREALLNGLASGAVAIEDVKRSNFFCGFAAIFLALVIVVQILATVANN